MLNKLVGFAAAGLSEFEAQQDGLYSDDAGIQFIVLASTADTEHALAYARHADATVLVIFPSAQVDEIIAAWRFANSD